MNESMKNRVISAANCLLQNNLTIREVAKRFGVGKSTIHLDLSQRLKHINSEIYQQVKKQLQQNKEDRHYRGGEATKMYWKKKNKNKKEY